VIKSYGNDISLAARLDDLLKANLDYLSHQIISIIMFRSCWIRFSLLG